MNREYKNLIFTKHALERLGKRNILQDAVWQVLNYPDSSHKKNKNTTKFIRTINDRKHHVVANYLTDEQKWLIVSVWVRGEEDKLPFIWQLITLPFKILWWVVKKIWGTIKKPKN